MVENTAIWTPEGVKTLGKAPERVEVPVSIMRWFRQGADVLTPMKIGLHCAKCGADFIGKNADTDTAFALVCGCRELISVNPSPKPRNMYDR